MADRMTNKQVIDIASRFQLCGEVMAIKKCEIGHINRTYVITCKNGKSNKRYVMQMINTNVFKKPDEVMENIVNVTGYIRENLLAEGIDPSRRTLNVIYTKDGDWGYLDGDGKYWRFYDYIEDSDNYNQVESCEMFEKVGYAFGHFQMQLKDFDASKLHETIPNFHNTEWRFDNLLTAMVENKVGRAQSVFEELKFAIDRRNITTFVNRGIADGTLSLRVTHNDTKLNNIMIDHETGEGICVIDLDTVMPGSVLADFGDSIRFGASSAAEDETDLDRVYCRLDMFEAFAKGFIEGCDGNLTDAEIELLPVGAMMMTLECGMRFLTDYLDGDVYFKISPDRPRHNLDRARCQFALLADMERKLGK